MAEERAKVHILEVIMFIALCTYLSGGDGFYDMEDYAKARQDWLRKRIGMQSIPSHDTLNRVFQAISPSCFGECLIELSRQLSEQVSRDIVAFDGKTHRRTDNKGSAALHTLNAWIIPPKISKISENEATRRFYDEKVPFHRQSNFVDSKAARKWSSGTRALPRTRHEQRFFL